MSKRFYDCSSLVSRVYRKYDVYFGSKSGWSPVAADIGKWCTRNHKVIAKKAVSYKKLLPGDLIFFSGWRNGRYKNITHIEIYRRRKGCVCKQPLRESGSLWIWQRRFCGVGSTSYKIGNCLLEAGRAMH